MKLVLIPAGEFTMGSPDSDPNARPDEKPQHRVRITRPFYIGAYLVTQGEYRHVTERYAIQPPQGDNISLPTSSKNWREATELCSRLSEIPEEQQAGRSYRLPTEAEWEYACRAGSITKWYFGDSEASLADYAWGQQNAGGKNHPVGEKKPNAWGLYDMYGNASQWCSDWYDRNYYQVSPAVDPQGPPTGTERVLRGSTFFEGNDPSRSAGRSAMVPQNGGSWTCFRVVMVPVR